jgi:hypothetical protein
LRPPLVVAAINIVGTLKRNALYVKTFLPFNQPQQVADPFIVDLIEGNLHLEMIRLIAFPTDAIKQFAAEAGDQACRLKSKK